jgi:hypothetical protein
MKKNFSKQFGNSRSIYYFFILLGIMFLGSILFVAINNKEPFENSQPSPPQSKVNIEYFYMESCPYCVEFKVIWDKVSKDTKFKNVIV